MQDLVGKTIKDRYRVEQLIGRGGMAEVYKVWDESRADLLAMKVLREDLAQDKVFLRRFEREAQTLAKLQHRSIVRFYGLEQDDVLVFLLLEYVEGSSLRERIFRSKDPFSMQQVLEVLRPVCAALHYAHQLGIVHCDLKPGNILVNNHGEYLVTDFGVARMVDASTSTMVGIGTPAYMAPELIKGQDPTPQTDIYALGVILYEMLAGGERPFTGERAETTGSTAEKIRWEQVKLEPKPLQEFNPALPAAAGQVVLHCLVKLPAQRYADIQEVYAELQGLAGDEKEPIQRPKQKEKEPQERLPRVSNNSPRSMQGIESSAEAFSSHRQIIKKAKDQPRSENSPFIVHVRTQMGDFHDFDLKIGKLIISDKKQVHIKDLSNQQLNYSFPFEKDHNQIKYSWSHGFAYINCINKIEICNISNQKIVQSLESINSDIVEFELSHNENFCVGLLKNGMLVSWDIKKGESRLWTSIHGDSSIHVHSVPKNNCFLRISELREIQCIDFSSFNKTDYTIDGVAEGQKSIICSPKGKYSAICNSNSHIVILDTAGLSIKSGYSQIKKTFLISRNGSTALSSFNSIPIMLQTAVFSHDEKYLIVIDNAGAVGIFDVLTLHEIARYVIGVVGINKALLSEDGRYLVTLCKDQRLDVWQCNWDALPGVREG